MTGFRAKLWAGVGAVAFAGAVAGCQPAQKEPDETSAMSHHEAGEAAKGETGGESAGGESGEGGGQILEGLSPADALAVRVAFMRGHLAVGMKLVEEGAGREAAAHFMHPIIEVYTPSKAEFDARNATLDTKAFEAAAEAASSGKPAAEVRKLYEGLVHQIDKAAPKSGEYSKAGTIKLLMQQLAHEYAEGVQGGLVANEVEYQDAYGFSVVLNDMVKDAIKDGNAKDPSRSAELQREAERLLNMFPSATPPSKPASPGEVQAQLSRIELSMSGME